jgi:hypothetical protein
MKIVVCGSVNQNSRKMKRLARQLQGHGHSVLYPDLVPFPHTHVPREKTANRNMYYKAIENSDLVIFVSNDHVGFETACEVGYTLACKKQMVFTSPLEVDGIKSILDEGKAVLVPLDECYGRRRYGGYNGCIGCPLGAECKEETGETFA